MTITRRDALSLTLGAAVATPPSKLEALTSPPAPTTPKRAARPLLISNNRIQGFDALVADLFPTFAASSYYPELRSSMLVAQNPDETRGVRAFTVLMSSPSAGRTLSRSLPILRQPDGKAAMLAQFNVIAPSGAALFLNQGFVLYRKKAASRISAKRTELLLARLTKIQRSQNLNLPADEVPSVDAVVYNDWTLVGADTAELKAHLECGRNAQHDQAVSILRASKKGLTTEALHQHLAAHISRYDQKPLGSREQLYWKHRSEEATRLRFLLDGPVEGRWQARAESLRRFPLTKVTASNA